MPVSRTFADHAWLTTGFESNVRFGLGCAPEHRGEVVGAEVGTVHGDAEFLGGYVVPGIPNVHSHAFQRAMAGLAERRGNSSDSFWTWREAMYAFAGRVEPDDLCAIATQLYVDMLKAGYTQVCEFHYLHHQPDGRPYADPAAMSLALVEAARDAGIGLTLLPTLYMSGGFDGRTLTERQRRFGHDVESYLRLIERLRALQSSTLQIGIAFHSLRAVTTPALRDVLAADVARTGPIHIHIAEQLGEVQDCLAIRKARPVEWLLDNAAVDARWCLVHATHMSDAETRRLAASGAVAGLCPTTEANLGDGLFRLKEYLDAGGAIGIGSDSNISVSPVEELRWLEYGQRLITKHRNVAASAAMPSTGEALFALALEGGARAAGVDVGHFTPRANGAGARADFVVLDDAAPLLAGRDAKYLIDTWLFASHASLVRDVKVGGDWVVRDFRHRDEERIASRYRDVVGRLARESSSGGS